MSHRMYIASRWCEDRAIPCLVAGQCAGPRSGARTKPGSSWVWRPAGSGIGYEVGPFRQDRGRELSGVRYRDEFRR